MAEKFFYSNSGPHTLQKIATAIGCEISKTDAEKEFYEIKSLSEAVVLNWKRCWKNA